jgi:putative membrane protein
MKSALRIGGLLGLTAFVMIIARSDIARVMAMLQSAGASLLLIVPYRIIFFALYALGWLYLLRPVGERIGVSFPFLLWVTAVREAIDRLLPVASVGGGVVGVRLLRRRGVPPGAAASSVLIEIALTVCGVYLFAILGALAWRAGSPSSAPSSLFGIGLWLSLPVPVALLLLLRYGRVFSYIAPRLRWLLRANGLVQAVMTVDAALLKSFARTGNLVRVEVLQLLALCSVSLEVWFVLRLLGQPVDLRTALIMEAALQAAKHVAFAVPGSLGVQEAALILVGQAFGIDASSAVALSLAKRMRELLCGIPALFSWQLFELHRMHGARSST